MTLVEVMAAALVLIVGMLGVATLVNTANKTMSTNQARARATELARELIEQARTLEYEDLTAADVQGLLRAKPGLADGRSSGEWKLSRGGVVFTVGVTACTFDDPKDGLAAPTSGPDAADYCPLPAAVSGAPEEKNPDDFRRVTVTTSWELRGDARTTTVAGLVVNPTGGLGPRIRTFPQPVNQIATPAFAWSPTSAPANPLTSDPAATLEYNSDNPRIAGLGTSTAADGRQWRIDLAFGTATTRAGAEGDPSYVYDGAYVVSAQAYDTRGIPGEAFPVQIHLNRRVPFAPKARGGRNTFGGTDDVVDLDWPPSPERDVVGYRVSRVVGSTVETVCPPSGPATAYVTDTSCTDQNPPPDGTAVTYRVVAMDCADLKATVCSPRAGDVEPVPVGTAGPAPAAPANLTGAIVDGRVQLRWQAPAGETPPTYYRIYRQQRDVGGRWGVTEGADASGTVPTMWLEPGVADTSQTYRYWVTAVGASFNESDFSNEVDLP